MMKIGLTGGIGAGKSLVAKIFSYAGVPVYIADKEAKRLMNHDKALKKDIRALLGNEAYHRNGRLNRPYISSRVFGNKGLLKKLNSLVHPAVKKDFIHWANNQSFAYVIEESALIFEVGNQSIFDKIIVVAADKELRIKRVMQRDKITREQVQSRMSNQWTQEKKVDLADFVIDNSGSASLIKQVMDIHYKLITKN